jgi:hypothetical protein
MPRYLTVLSIFVYPDSSCTHVSCGSTVDERRFGTSQGVRADKVRVEADRCNPARDEPGILPGGHAAVVITTATEQKFARFLANGFNVIVDGLARLLRQLKAGADRSSFAALWRDRPGCL